MGLRSGALFAKLTSKRAIEALIGQTENADFDCKLWFEQRSWKESIAKAACGFTNATGGVIIIGLQANAGKDGVDIVRESKPVPDVEATRSAALDAVLRFVEPGIEGIEARVVRLSSKSKSGFVMLHIPESEDRPRRSIATSEFYVRIASGTVPMEYFQIEDRFGRRPHARLSTEVKSETLKPAYFSRAHIERHFCVYVTNTGRGLARFPSIRCKKVAGITLQTHMAEPSSVWAISNTDEEWLSFRGGANDVVFPGESLRIATLLQVAPLNRQADYGNPGPYFGEAYFPAVTIFTEAVCEGTPAHRQSFELSSANWP
jgi:Putative DNA-binding domain